MMQMNFSVKWRRLMVDVLVWPQFQFLLIWVKHKNFLFVTIQILSFCVFLRSLIVLSFVYYKSSFIFLLAINDKHKF